MYDLYISNKNYSSWSLRPWLLMRELQIPFQEKLVPFGAGAFASFSPSGKVPCLIDEGRIVWDTLAITEYLAERHEGVWPRDAAARAWARCAAAEMHSGFGELRIRCTMNLGLQIQLGDIPPALQCEIDRIDQIWTEGLRMFGGNYLAGADFSAVDAFYVPLACRFRISGLSLSEPAQRYAEWLLQLSSLNEWIVDALDEPWRDAEHEEEARNAGTWLEDRRAVGVT